MKEEMVDALEKMWLIVPGETGLLYGDFVFAGETVKGALDVAAEQENDEAFERIMTEALRRHPVDPELYARQVRHYRKLNDSREVVDNAILYTRSGGRDADIISTAIEAAEKLELEQEKQELISILGES